MAGDDADRCVVGGGRRAVGGLHSVVRRRRFCPAWAVVAQANTPRMLQFRRQRPPGAFCGLERNCSSDAKTMPRVPFGWKQGRGNQPAASSPVATVVAFVSGSFQRGASVSAARSGVSRWSTWRPASSLIPRCWAEVTGRGNTELTTDLFGGSGLVLLMAYSRGDAYGRWGPPDADPVYYRRFCRRRCQARQIRQVATAPAAPTMTLTMMFQKMRVSSSR